MALRFSMEQPRIVLARNRIPAPVQLYLTHVRENFNVSSIDYNYDCKLAPNRGAHEGANLGSNGH